jgi:hypothetical protein
MVFHLCRITFLQCRHRMARGATDYVQHQSGPDGNNDMDGAIPGSGRMSGIEKPLASLEAWNERAQATSPFVHKTGARS